MIFKVFLPYFCSSYSSIKKNVIDTNRRLIFSSSDEDDVSERVKISTNDDKTKGTTRRKKNIVSSDNRTRRKKNFGSSEDEKSSSDSDTEFKIRRKKNVDSSGSWKDSSIESKIKIKTKRRSIKRTPKVVSSPVKRISKTAPKSLNHKKSTRFSLQSKLQPSFLASLSSKYSSLRGHP